MASESTPLHQHHPHTAYLQEASTGTAGVVVEGIVGDEDSLYNKLAPEEYGATEQQTESSGGTAGLAAGTAGTAGKTRSIHSATVEPLSPAQLKWVVGSLWCGAFLAALDSTVVTTLLTTIASDMDAIGNIAWIATAYLLSCSAFQPIYGKLSDIFGRKPLLVMCTVFFGLGCAICVTNNLWVLVVGRFITGIGGSGLTTLGTITMLDLIPLRDRGLYQGLANIFYGLGAASGGIIGGVVADTLGWQYVFILQIPLCIIVGCAIYFNLQLPEGSPGLGVHGDDMKQKLKRVDFLGSLFLVSALMVILTAASLGGSTIPFASVTFVALVILSVVLLGAFAYTETYVSAEPIIPIELLGERTILSSSLTNWFQTMAIFTYMFYLPVYYASVLGLSSTDSGLRLVPNFFGISFGSVGAGIYMKRTGTYYYFAIIMGLLSIFGTLRIYNIQQSIPTWEQFTLMVPSGIGYSAMLTVTLLSLIAAVPVKYQACTTSIQYTFRSTGSTIGVSIGLAIFQKLLLSNLYNQVPQLIRDPEAATNIIKRALENADYIKKAPPVVQQVLKDSYALACKGAFLFSLITIICGVVSSTFMKEHVLHSSLNRK
ncbi:uncharacterized protein KQ657_002603 [Scheffersomyces spartinae]|uniref:Major facilitator superfamily (MFS) profile domain-containing protein n=1 Tax=Scheffersomyces spartinae TaxID=45513 RepID=A0A9P8AH07_9ASCO|nr:uncharacterized protein KQ657_002603 [Scheffersomyces spartinae]KAG7191996.1 hypothetical protein KQ657_002603 [Scheffersomyces spartinae]